MILVYRPWLSRLLALVVAFFTLGLVRLDTPRVGRVRKMGFLRRLFRTRHARYSGRRDGRAGIPRVGERQAPPEIWKLKQSGDSVMRGFAAAWSASDSRLRGELEAIAREVTATGEVIRRFDPQIAELEAHCKRRTDRLTQMKGADEKRQAEERWRVPTKFYVAALLIILVGEFPLNAVAFN